MGAKVAMLLLVAGCGARLADPAEAVSAPDAAVQPPPVDAPAAAPLTATGFIDQFADLQSTEVFACRADYPGGDAAFTSSFGSSEADYDTFVRGYYNPAKIEVDIAKGRVAYDALAAATCLAGIVFGTCPSFWQTSGSYPDACGQALVGSVQLGGGCVSPFECASLNCGSDQHCAQ